MPQHAELILTITAAMAFALMGGFIAAKLRAPPILGYLLAGMALGPFTPGYSANQELATQLAEIGVVLLMFGVGIQFSLKDLGAIRNVAVVGSFVQGAVITALGMLAAWWWGWSFGAGLVIGLSVSVASTVILLRGLIERRLIDSLAGRVAVAWVVIEDLRTVAVLVLLPVVALLLAPDFESATLLSDGVLLTLALTLVKILAFMGIMMFVGARAVPWLLDQVARVGSREMFTLAVLASALGIAVGASVLFGVSLALGAFVAGLVISESDLSHQAAAEALPFRDAFAVLFFVSVGMLFNPFVLADLILPTLAVAGIVLLGKPLVTAMVAVMLGQTPRTGIIVGIGLAQIGEFSFVLADMGRSLQLLPEGGYHIVLACALVSISANPFLFRLVPILERRLSGMSLPFSGQTAVMDTATAEGGQWRGHAVIAGFAPAGGLIARALALRGFRLLVVDDNRRRVEELRQQGLAVVFGNPSHPLILEHAYLEGARTMIVLLDDPILALQVIRTARQQNPNLDIVATARTAAERQALMEGGATEVVSADMEMGLEVARHTMHRFGVESQQIQLLLQRLRRGA